MSRRNKQCSSLGTPRSAKAQGTAFVPLHAGCRRAQRILGRLCILANGNVRFSDRDVKELKLSRFERSIVVAPA